MSIITKTKELTTAVAAFAISYKEVQEQAHVIAVSAIWHVAKFGDVTNLNRLNAVLSSNDQTALKMYLRRIQTVNGLVLGGDNVSPEGLPSEVLNQKLEAGAIVTFKKGEYVVVKGHTSDAATNLVGLCETRFITPDGKEDKKVFERNNFAEQKTFGDVEVLDTLAKQITQALAPSTEKRVNNLSTGTRSYLESLLDAMKQRKSQLTLSAG